METQSYSYRSVVDLSYNDALSRVKDTLKEEGFGVLTEIDVDATIQQKLNIDFGKHYSIIGACNPQLAYQALQSETELGLLLPCNVIVYEDESGTVVAAINPEVAMKGIGNPNLETIAVEAGSRLRRAVDKV